MIKIPFIFGKNTVKVATNGQSAEQMEMEKKPSDYELSWDKFGRFLLYILVVLTPLWFLPITVFPVAQNKQFLATLLVLIVLILWLIKVLATGRIVVPRAGLSLAVLGFLVLLALSTLFSISRVASIWGTDLQPDTLFSFLVYAIAFFMVPSFFTRTEHLLKAVLLFSIGLFILSLFAILQIFGVFVFPFDFAKQSGFNPVGTVQSLTIFVAYGFVMLISFLTGLRLPKILKLGFAALAFLDLAILLLVNFRWAWLGVLAAIALVTSWQIMRSRGILAPQKFSLPLLVLILSAVFLFLRFPLSSFLRLPSEVSPSYSASFVVAGKSITFPRIFLGSGPATFAYDYSLHRSRDLNYTQFWGVRFNQGFAVFPTLLATGGILTLLFFLGIVGLFGFAGLRGLSFINGKNAALEGVALSSFAGGVLLFLMWFLYPLNFVLALFAFISAGFMLAALWQGGALKTFEFSFLSSPQRTLLISLLVIVVIAMSAIGIYWHVQKYIAAVFYGNALQAVAKNSNVDQIIAKLSQTLNLDGTQDRYHRTLSQVLLLKAGQTLRRQDLKPDELQTQFQVALQGAVQVAQQATQLNPADSLNWSQAGSVYENVVFLVNGADKFATDFYEKVLERDPSNPQARLDIARTLVTAADKIQNDLRTLRQQKQLDKQKEEALNKDYGDKLDKALDYIGKALELKTDFTPAHFLAAQVYERQGKRNLAIEKTIEARNINPFDVGIAFQLGLLYYLDNQLDNAKKEFERAVTLNENYSNARYFLGLIYDKQGQKDKAIEQFEKVVALNPDNTEVKQILDNLKAGEEALAGIAPPPQQRTETPLPETGGAEKKAIKPMPKKR